MQNLSKKKSTLFCVSSLQRSIVLCKVALPLIISDKRGAFISFYAQQRDFVPWQIEKSGHTF